MTFAPGLEVALDEEPAALRGRALGLLLNQASVDRGFRLAHDLLAERWPGRLRALFGPQHGLWSEQQDNMIETTHARDPRLGVPVFSLYSETRTPTAEMLDGIDALVVDLQDAGTRVYTYVWTLLHCLRACARHGVAVVVLDRPNPLGGVAAEGPPLRPEFASFVGEAPIPMRHGLTIGELARHLARTLAIDVELHVVPMRGWQRAMLWPDLGRPWVPTSPNLPRWEGVLLYPGQVLLEGTMLSEGRGTTTPFELAGAPFVDPYVLIERLEQLGAAHCALRPVRFEPTFQKWANRSCGGVFLHPIDPVRLESFRFGVAVIGAAASLWRDGFAWRPPPYEYEHERMPIDILAGSAALRAAVDRGLDRDGLDELCAFDRAAWWDTVAPDLLYPR